MIKDAASNVTSGIVFGYLVWTTDIQNVQDPRSRAVKREVVTLGVLSYRAAAAAPIATSSLWWWLAYEQ